MRSSHDRRRLRLYSYASCSIAILSLLTACDNNEDRSENARGGNRAPTTRSAAVSDEFIGKPASKVIPLCEYEGRLRRLVLHAPDNLVGQTWRAVHDLIIALPPDVQVTFACSSAPAVKEVEGRLRQWKFDKRGGIDWFCVEGPLSVWARDRYIALRPGVGSDSSRWLIPALVQNRDVERRSYEKRVARVLAGRRYKDTIVQSPLILEGGNLLTSNNCVYVGASILKDNALHGTQDKIKTALGELFGLPVVLVADENGSAPVAHLDMFVTLLDDERVLVGSPTLAVDIMKNPDAVSQKALRERFFILPEVADESVLIAIAERSPSFDAISQSLSDAGLHVTRIPYADSRNGDFIVTYNNVIQEQRDGRHIVYMPTYGIPALDAAARKIYEKLGCEVKPIDVSAISHLLGAVRCLANVTERSPDVKRDQTR